MYKQILAYTILYQVPKILQLISSKKSKNIYKSKSTIKTLNCLMIKRNILNFKVGIYN